MAHLFLNSPASNKVGDKAAAPALIEDLNSHVTCGVWAKRHTVTGADIRSVPLTLGMFDNPFDGDTDYCALPVPLPATISGDFTVVPSAGYIIREPRNLKNKDSSTKEGDSFPFMVNAKGFYNLNFNVREVNGLNTLAQPTTQYIVHIDDNLDELAEVTFGDDLIQVTSHKTVFWGKIHTNLPSTDNMRLIVPYFFSKGAAATGGPAFSVPALDFDDDSGDVTLKLMDISTAYYQKNSMGDTFPTIILPLNFGQNYPEFTTSNSFLFRCWMDVLEDGFSTMVMASEDSEGNQVPTATPNGTFVSF